MFVFDTLTIILLAIASNPAFITVVQATPLLRRDVITPKIITPNAHTVWTVGHIETVTWETSNFPPDSQISNPIGRVILGHQTNDSLNLDFDHPLASGFNLRDGTVQLTVPDVPARDDYIIVLYGDSGNTSPAFTITRITRGSPSSSSSSSSAASESSPVPSGETPPPQSPSSISSTSPRPQVLTAELPTPSSTVSYFTTTSLPSSISYSTSLSSSSSSPSSVPAISSGTSSLISMDKSKFVALTSCMTAAHAILFLLV